MTQTLYFITQNGQPISMETWTDKEKAQAIADVKNESRIRKLVSDVCNAAAFFTLDYNRAKQSGGTLSYGLDSRVKPIIRATAEFVVHSRISSDNASEATPIKVEMGKPETKCS